MLQRRPRRGRASAGRPGRGALAASLSGRPDAGAAHSRRPADAGRDHETRRRELERPDDDTTNGSVTNVSWARDGSRLFFDRFWERPSGVYSIPPLGGEPTLLLEDGWAPQALPDGSLVVLKRTPRGHDQAFRFWPESGRSEPLPAYLERSDAGPPLRAFADGKEIVFIGATEEAASKPARSRTSSISRRASRAGSIRKRPSIARFSVGTSAGADSRRPRRSDAGEGTKQLRVDPRGEKRETGTHACAFIREWRAAVLRGCRAGWINLRGLGRDDPVDLAVHGGRQTHYGIGGARPRLTTGCSP